MNSRGEGGEQYVIQDHRPGTARDTVFSLLLRMHTIVMLLIYTCLWGLMKSTPVITDKDSRPSKYTAQLFDYLTPSIKVLSTQYGAQVITIGGKVSREWMCSEEGVPTPGDT